MVAGIDVAIALHDGCVTALFGIDADAWFRAHPSGEGGIEELHKDFWLELREIIPGCQL